MVAVTRELIPDHSTDASFRAWGKQLSDDLTSFGLSKTADTGQINWTTVSKPTGSMMLGYEIRQFADTLQSSNPVLFKIGYGAAYSAAIPALEITVGTTSNGTGTLTGKFSPAVTLQTYASSPTAKTCVFSGSSNRVAIALFSGLADGASFFSIERTKNAIGEDTGSGILFFTCAAPGKFNYFIPFVGLIPPAMNSGLFTPTGITTAVQDSDVNVYPNYFFNMFGTILSPGINHVAYFQPDVTLNTIKQILIYNTNRSYYFLPNDNYVATPTRGNVASTCLAMLYE